MFVSRFLSSEFIIWVVVRAFSLQIQNLESEIQEKRRQMRVLEQRITESGEASVASASLVDMQQVIILYHHFIIVFIFLIDYAHRFFCSYKMVFVVYVFLYRF